MNFKSFVFFLSLAIFVIPDLFSGESIPYKFQVIKEDQSGIHFSLNFDRQIFADPENFDRLIQQFFLIWQDSTYGHPVLTKSFIPFTRDVTVQVLKTNYELIRYGSLNIPVEKSIDSLGLSVSGSYGQVKLFPENRLVKVSRGGDLLQTNYRNVHFFPLQRGQNSNEARFYYQIEGKINFDQSSPLTKFDNSGSSLRVNNRSKEMIINYSSWQKFRQQSQPSLSKQITGPGYDFSRSCNIFVSQDGWYTVTYSDLKQAGVPVDYIDTKKIQLFCKGKEIPLYLSDSYDNDFNQGEAFEFWGELNRNTNLKDAEDIYYDMYSISSVYILLWERNYGLRYGSQTSLSSTGRAPANVPSYFERKIHIEYDRRYYRLGWVTVGENRDHFFTASIAGGELEEILFDLPIVYPYAIEPIRLKLWFHGRSKANHNFDLFLNRHYVGEGQWYGPEKYLFEAEVNDVGGSILHIDEEQHTLMIGNRSLTELDLILFNWMELEFPQAYEAKDNFLIFTRPKNEMTNFFQFRLKQFTSPDVEIFKINSYRVYKSDILTTLDSLNTATYQVRFQDECFSADAKYVALTPDKKLTPDSLFVYSTNKDLTSQQNQGDFLIVTHSKFENHPKLAEFIRWREKDYSVKLVNIEDIYQQFNFGITGPIGLKSFIQYTREFWKKPAPSYILFIGDGNYNYRSPIAQRENYIPVYHYQTYQFGAVVSDSWYVVDENDNLSPDLHIGRWPVQELEELDIVISKTLAYEQTPVDSDWQNRLLMIAGNEEVFRLQTRNLIDQVIPEEYFRERLHSSPVDDPFFGHTDRLIESWNEGLAYLNFRGHGGGAVWADNLLFSFEDVERLNNLHHLPFISSMTCFTNSFDGRANLSEALLFHKTGGCVAMFGSAGIGWVWNDYYLLNELINEMYTSPNATIGSIVTMGKINYSRKYFTPQRTSTIHQYILLGDPTTILKLPWQKIELDVTQLNFSAGDLITVTGTLPFSGGQIITKLLSEDGIVIFEAEKNSTSPIFSTEVRLPEDLTIGKYWIKLFGFNNNQNLLAHGAVPISLAGLSLHQVYIEPPFPVEDDSIRIKAQILGLQDQNSAQVFFAYFKAGIDSFQMEKTEKSGLYQKLLPPNFGETGEYIHFYVSVISGQNYVKSDPRELRISQNPDFIIVSNSIKLVNRDNALKLTTKIYNQSDISGDSLVVEFWVNSPVDTNFVFLEKDKIQLNSYQTTEAAVKWPFQFGNYQIKVKIDPDKIYQDSNLDNNIISTYLKTTNMQISEFTLQQNILNVEVDSCLLAQIHITPDMLNKIMYITFSGELKTAQQELQNIQPDNWQKPVYYIGFLSEQDNLSVYANLEFRLDSLDFIVTSADSQLALYYYYSQQNRWARMIGQKLENNVLTLSSNKLGFFTWFRSNDLKPPDVKILPQNRGFYDGGFVQKNPTFTVSVQDNNGAHPDISQIKILLNGETIESPDVDIKSNYQNNAHLFQFDLAGLNGQNRLSVSGLDWSGNISQPTEIKFKVDQKFEIIPLGNYPNPFIDQTVFCYELSNSAENLVIKIFTVSGKLIRTIRDDQIIDDPNPNEVGYHEIIWTGLDENGDEVANGVYFYQYVVRREGKVAKKEGKLARIR